MVLPETTIEWEGLTLYGTRAFGRTTFRTLTGWEGWDGRSSMTDRPTSHGAFDSAVLGNARRVTVSGRAGSPQERDAVLALLGETFVPAEIEAPPSDLRVTHGGRALTAGARLLRYAPTSTAWGAGWFDWAAEWVCPDPVRYGDPTAVTTAFPRSPGGLRFPLFTNRQGVWTGVLTFGPRATSGRVTLTNPGSATLYPLLQVTGPVPVEGFDVVAVGTGKRLRFEDAFSATSVLVIDTATGNVVLDGDGDRAGRLTVRDWDAFWVPRRGSLEIEFVPRGAITDAELTAVTRPGWW
jgi:hypothetical protein